MDSNMWITNVEIANVRSFEEPAVIDLSRNINVLVGSNNSGKSTIIKALYLLQNQNSLTHQDVRIGKTDAIVRLGFADPDPRKIGIGPNDIQSDPNSSRIFFKFNRNSGMGQGISRSRGIPDIAFSQIAPDEPGNFIYPYLSKRKVTNYDQTISTGNTTAVRETLIHLYSKIDRLANPEYPAHKEFKKGCNAILGFTVSAYQSPNGKQAGLTVNNFDNISLESMGEGVTNLLGLIVHLCVAKNNLFLIEEPENDIHPRALKSLLELILKKSESNQFVISTHSNIVTKYLGSHPSNRVFSLTVTLQDKLPTSTIQLVNNSAEDRRIVLEDLGYEMFDVELWKGWLFLEESSAERIIKDYLIPWFAKDVQGKLRTFSCHSSSEVETKFDDFNRLLVFLHLEPAYKNKAWVVVDDGQGSKKIIEPLRAKYLSSGWTEDHFLTFSKSNFEEFYPERFQPEVKRALSLDRREKREAKSKLLDKVLSWIKDDPSAARWEFEKSATEVIEILKKISSVL